MKREIVHIDENICNGCGQCVPACHEGALQIIDGKARLVSDLMCDGLGACLGECPLGAIKIESREAEPYNETAVMEQMVAKGKNTVVAHLKHLKEHNENDFLKEGVAFLKNNEETLTFNLKDVMDEVHNQNRHHHHHGSGCPGAKEMSFPKKDLKLVDNQTISGQSELHQWPVQMHLINPQAAYFKNADVVLAADCVAFALGNFHQKHLKGKSLAIACPKLDRSLDVYQQKIQSMIEDAKINTLTVMIMQVPCCRGLLQLAQNAVQLSSRRIPVKMIVVGIEGEILQEEWVS